MRILVVEDSDRIARMVERALASQGHTVVIAANLASANTHFELERFDLAIIDIGLPDGSGLEWCRKTRAAGSNMPILILTARSSVDDRVSGLDAGADDYLGKPFAVDEFLARIRALSRRGPRWTESARSYGELMIDRDRRVVTVGNDRVALTPREFEIVASLAWRDGRIVSRDDLLESVWGESSASASASFDVLITRIRRKLGDRGIDGAIQTIRQVGYAWALANSKHT